MALTGGVRDPGYSELTGGTGSLGGTTDAGGTTGGDATGIGGSTDPVSDTHAGGTFEPTGNATGGSAGQSTAPESSSVASLLPARCSGACNAATPSSPTLVEGGGLGNVTMYTTEASSGGACLYGETSVRYFAAMSVNIEPGDAMGHWQGGRICGQCAKVTAITSHGPTEVVVRIMDKCPDGDCGIDLGGAAPDAIMADGYGRYEGAWEFVSCVGHDEVFDGPTALFVKDGANAFWSAVQIRNPPMAVAEVRWRSEASGASGSFEYAAPQIENYYMVPIEVLESPDSLIVTVEYSDGSAKDIAVTGAQLAQAEASYPFE